MTDEVGVVTGDLTLRTEYARRQVTLRVQYKDADEWYAVTGGRAALADPAGAGRGPQRRRRAAEPPRGLTPSQRARPPGERPCSLRRTSRARLGAETTSGRVALALGPDDLAPRPRAGAARRWRSARRSGRRPWLAAGPISRSSGPSVSQRVGCRNGQRVWKRQPRGGLAGVGRSPREQDPLAAVLDLRIRDRDRRHQALGVRVQRLARTGRRSAPPRPSARGTSRRPCR